MQKRQILPLFMAILMLCLSAAPAAAAEGTDSTAAVAMQLVKTQGVVNVTSASERAQPDRAGQYAALQRIPHGD